MSRLSNSSPFLGCLLYPCCKLCLEVNCQQLKHPMHLCAISLCCAVYTHECAGRFSRRPTPCACGNRRGCTRAGHQVCWQSFSLTSHFKCSHVWLGLEYCHIKPFDWNVCCSCSDISVNLRFTKCHSSTIASMLASIKIELFSWKFWNWGLHNWWTNKSHKFRVAWAYSFHKLLTLPPIVPDFPLKKWR